MTTIAADAVELAEIDIIDVKWFEDGTPHELFARMRAEAPVRWNPLPDGTGCWSVTRHADISAISRDTETFSSYNGGIFLHPDQVLPLDLARNLLLYMDPPQHTKYRLILQKAFTPHTVSQLEDTIRARVTKTLDAVIEQGTCDFAHDIAVPIPLGMITQLMGVPEVDVAQFYEWTEKIEAAQRAPEPNAASDVFVQMAGYIHAQIERQIAEGGTDSLVMKLREAEVDGEGLSDPEILVFFGLLAFAGNDTTRNTLANGMHALLQHPDQLQALVDDPSLIPNAVEEILRYTSVVRWFNRTATRDTELGGQKIAEGDRVIMWYASASFDEEVVEDPTRFDIRRPKPDHKAFGGGGRHFCLGAGLARAELRIALEEITRRMPDLQQAGDVERLQSSWANGLVKLPISFTPGPRS
ncbi:MAG: cytochrome [Solirubrobacterales bacterium]|nr:cytochrome [Solirubrobacterales bacterium]